MYAAIWQPLCSQWGPLTLSTYARMFSTITSELINETIVSDWRLLQENVRVSVNRSPVKRCFSSLPHCCRISTSNRQQDKTALTCRRCGRYRMCLLPMKSESLPETPNDILSAVQTKSRHVRWRWITYCKPFQMQFIENLCYFLPRDAVQARHMLSSCVRPSVCLSVRLSGTSWYCIKTAKHRITHTTPHDSPGNLLFGRKRSPQNSTGVNP